MAKCLPIDDPFVAAIHKKCHITAHEYVCGLCPKKLLNWKSLKSHYKVHKITIN